MSFNILDHVALGYQPIWGRTRQLDGVRLRVRVLHPDQSDIGHCLNLLHNEWAERSPRLIVSLADLDQLQRALVLKPFDGLWLELPDLGHFTPPELAQAIQLARHNGHTLVQTAPLARALAAGPSAQRHLLDLWPEQAEQALQAAAQRRQPQPGQTPLASPVLPHQIYQHIGSRALADHCLDDQGAWGIAGWPNEDVLHAHRPHGVQADKLTLVRVQQALAADKSMEVVEDLIHQDAVLTYRLLRLVNSSVFGPDRHIDTIRQALMMLGQRQLRDWLTEQLPSAATDKDLLPVRQALVLRSRLMASLMDPGPQHDLRAEILVTGLFSGLGALLQEPLGLALQRLPLSDAISNALLRSEGPYAPYLDIATRLERFELMEQLPAICHEHDFAIGDVNRSLIRTLAQWRNAI